MTRLLAPETAPHQPLLVERALRVGAANDPAEAEADAVADRVRGMPGNGTIHRCPCGGGGDDEIQRQPADGLGEEPIQAKAASGANGGVLDLYTADRVTAARTGGQPLNPTIRHFFEPRFGTDLSHVRTHTDATAHQLATDINARAFTTGSHIFFGPGEHQPDSPTHLLAHELAHTRQQTGRQLTSVERTVRRWAISGDTATSDSTSDTLGRLANRAGALFDDWTCIRPISMRTSRLSPRPSDFDARYERYVQIGDRFDISNLTAKTGKTLRLHLFDASQWRDANIAAQFYPGATSSADPDIDIETAAVTAPNSTPIADFVLFGHAGGNTMFGGAGSFTPSSFMPNDPAQTFGQAEQSFFPRRCWLARNAKARAVGCNSNTFGADFAAAYLRRGSEVTATTASVRPHCVGSPASLATLSGNAGGCAWYNQLAFTASPATTAAILDGPFSTVAGFHGSSFWATTKGTL